MVLSKTTARGPKDDVISLFVLLYWYSQNLLLRQLVLTCYYLFIIQSSCRLCQRYCLMWPETLSSPVSADPWTSFGLWQVGLPIGLGAAAGIITGKTSRSNWFTVGRA